MNTNRGFTLLELIITMALFIVIIMITGSAFESILKNTARVVSSEESNIEGVVGLEMFRHDLQQMGFGLSYAFTVAPKYPEATATPANLLNDGKGVTLSGNVPRAVASLESISGYANILTGTDYLAIKATTVGRSKASQKWTFLTYTTSSDGKIPNQWSNSSENFVTNDYVILLDRTFSTTGQVTNALIYPTGDPTIYWACSPTDTMNDVAFNPTNSSQVFYLYGVDSAKSCSVGLKMPFNRADYFVSRPSDATSIPTTCAPGTGILYKANVNHADGKLTYYPLLDCVADMQVVFGWDVNGNGVIDESGAYNSTSANIPLSSASGVTKDAIKTIMESAEEIRNKLKYIKVYIMAQEGRKDTNFVNTNNQAGGLTSVVVGEPGPNPPSNATLTHAYSVTNLNSLGWLNYRWKIYRIVVRPKNLGSN